MHRKVVLRSEHGYDVDKASLEAGFECEGPSLTVQSEQDSADINTIVKNFGITGEVPVSKRVPLLLDIDDVIDYRYCVDTVKAAELSFSGMPANVRNRFDNDPVRFVEFFGDPKNRDEAISLGLIPKPPEAAPVPAVPAPG